MKLHIENIGKVGNATVAIDGMTVIAGSNGSGKSTLGRCLMTYANTMRRMDELVRDRKVERFITRVIGLLKLSDYLKHCLLSYVRYSEFKDKVLDSEFWNSEEKVKKIILAATKMYMEDGEIKKRIERSTINVNEIIAILAEVNQIPFTAYCKDILDDSFRRAFNKQINPLSKKEGVGEISVYGDDNSNKDDYAICFVDNKVSGMPKIIDSHFQPVVYVEPVHALDLSKDAMIYWGPRFDVLERYSAGVYGLDSVIRNRNYEVKYLEDEERDNIELLITELIAIVKGGLESVDEEMLFKEQFDNQQSAFVELENLASGAKTMSVVVHALRNGTLCKNRILVIDEPESNLHPEWQIKFAHALVMLQKRLSIKVLLNTHSPYFLKAIEFYDSKENEVHQARFYLMEKIATSTLYTAKDCTGETDAVFQTMYAPFEEIM